MSHSFRKCAVCGSCHGRDICPVREYNAELEARDRDRITAELLFPGQPILIEMLKQVQQKWLVASA